MLRFVAIGERALGTQQRKRMAHDRCRRPKMMLSKKLEQIICSPSLCASLYVEYVLHYVLLFAEQMHCVCVCVACTGSRYWWQRHLLAAHTYTAMHLHIATLPKVDEPRAVGNHQRMALAATQNDVAPQRKRNETVVR